MHGRGRSRSTSPASASPAASRSRSTPRASRPPSPTWRRGRCPRSSSATAARSAARSPPAGRTSSIPSSRLATESWCRSVMSAERVSSPRLATAVFVVLVLATVGAFFVIQRLKRATPVATKIHLQRYVSPNGDGRLDRAVIKFKLPKADDSVTVSITDANGDEVRRLADRRLKKGRHRFHWNGRDGSAAIVPDGFYYLRVVLNGEGRGSFSRDGVQVITKAPHAKLASVTPARVPPGARQAVTIRFEGPARPPALISVYRTDRGEPRLVTSFNAPAGEHTATWDARIGGRPAPPGTYAFGVTVQNVARVAGSSPLHLPPSPKTAVEHTGVTISGPSAAPQLEPVRAGTR